MAKLTKETLGAPREQEGASKDWIKIGMSSCGLAAGAEEVYQALCDGVKEQGLNVEVKKCGCLGACYAEPLVEINVSGAPRTLYANIDRDKAQWLLDAHVARKRVIDKFSIPGIEKRVRSEDDVPDGTSRTDECPLEYRIVLKNCGVIDPESIEDYLASDGYLGLKKALFSFSPEEVIEELTNSQLRGRGGAGFPTGLKWKLTRSAVGEQKYVICNADEGDPGAYMDRSILEGDPHAVVEGMIIAGYAIGASQGYFYIRAEYPLAIERIENAIRQAKQSGLLGRDILGSNFSFKLDVRLGAGAFVCGEETALIASIEGKRGTPQPRPPFPSVKGLWGCPTNINNVETLANVPRILFKGADWFSSIGTEKSKGTKVFAVTGKVARSGLVEIPMGVPLGKIVTELGGGTASGKAVKAVQTGGPSGGVIPAEHFDTPVSYEHLTKMGSIMGSGGLIVMEEGDSMVDIVKFYLGFCVEESCGKCAPCRHGGKQMLLILEKISKGEGEDSDISKLHQIARAMKATSLCGLGQTAANPVLSTLKYFKNEFDSAIAEKA